MPKPRCILEKVYSLSTRDLTVTQHGLPWVNGYAVDGVIALVNPSQQISPGRPYGFMLIQTVLIASVVRTDEFPTFYRFAKSGLGDVAGLFMIG